MAYHEIGHALVAALQSHSAPVQKITIIPRTSGALGLYDAGRGERQIPALQGRAGKQDSYPHRRPRRRRGCLQLEVTTGASNDIEQATKLARAMITRYGMSEDFGMVAMETVTNQYLGGDTTLSCSAETQRVIDQKVVDMIKKQHEKAVNMLKENREKLEKLAQYLTEKETITGEEFMKILDSFKEAAV